jgi:hypothetical protein
VLPSEEGLDPDRKPVARRVQVGLAATPGEQPGDVGLPPSASLLASDAELPHEVVCGVGRWHAHRHAEALDQASACRVRAMAR